MCVVSMIGDHFSDKWARRWSEIDESGKTTFPSLSITRAEFEDLKKEVEEMKLLLKRAKEYDERTNQPDCEIESKVALLKKMAELVGVDLEEIFGKGKQ